MKSQLDWSKPPWWLVAGLVVGAGLASCKTEDVDEAEEGSAGSASADETGGSSNGSAGDSATDIGGAAGAPAGVAGSGGTAGDGADQGTAAAGGDGAAADATGGAGGVDDCPPDPEEEVQPCEPADCVPRVPSDPLITDWEAVRCQSGLFLDGDAWTEPPPAAWWEGFFGGPFAYPEPDPSADVIGLLPNWDNGVLLISGTVDTYAGFGLWFEMHDRYVRLFGRQLQAVGECWAERHAHHGREDQRHFRP
jgi:hypothetical protein